MLIHQYFYISLVLLLLQAFSVYSSCFERKGVNETISDSYSIVGFIQYHKCWRVVNPAKNVMHFRLKELHLMTKPLISGNLTIMLKDEKKNYTFWSELKYGNITTSSTVVEIHFKVNSGSFPNNYKANFTLHFEMEVGIIGVESVRSNAITWLKSQRSPLLDWRENTLKAITALYLAGNATFNGTDMREELLIRRAESLVSRALQRNTVSAIDLGLYMNFLRVTCNSPRHFASQDLVQQLLDHLESSGNFTHPTIYLSLCNANEIWPERAITDLTNVLTSRSEYLFLKDIQSYAVMAASCYSNNSNIRNKVNITALLSQVKKTVEHLKKSQLSDGSFGNVQTTSLVTQALISSGLRNAKDWNLNATVKYLIKELNSTVLDFPTVYLTLPVFNGKSLSDIFKVNCTGNPRSRVIGSIKSEIDDYIGPKIRIQFSLFIGDKKDIIHTLFLRVPENYTAYQVMQYAEEEDYKYKFEWKLIMNKMYVYKIGKVINDPEVGTFWLMYLGSTNSTDYLQTTTSPDNIKMNDEGHLVMWYKTTSI